jgi:hypothetical protein
VGRVTAIKLKTLPAGRHAVGGGLYLEVGPSGARRWIVRLVVKGSAVRRHVGLGRYPVVPLKAARAEAVKYQDMARAGDDPKAVQRRGDVPLFRDAAATYIEAHTKGLRNGKRRTQWTSTMSTYAFPVIGDSLVSGVTRADVIAILEPIWNEKPETARRVRPAHRCHLRLVPG